VEPFNDLPAQVRRHDHDSRPGSMTVKGAIAHLKVMLER
jgi:hypothetical protein